MPGPTKLPPSYAARWSRLARAADLDPAEPVLVALSGGADSVLLLHLVAVAEPRPRILAVHVDHGLRGAESRADAAFCARLCRALAVPLIRRRIDLAADGPSLEARARDARYAVLAEEARAAGISTVLTGHHADDALETLMMRWLRGTHLGGLAGLKPARALADPPGSAPGRDPGHRHGYGPGHRPGLRVVRPLIHLRRAEVRRILADRGLAWRADSSNLSARFTRNRIRHALLPGLADVCGSEAIDNLRAFGAAVEALEDRLAAGTAHLAWSSPTHASARNARGAGTLGGTLPRSDLMRLVPPLRRRALWRLLYEGTGRPPSRRLLDLILDDLGAGRCTRHSLPSRFGLQLRSDRLHLLPPERSRAGSGAAPRAAEGSAASPVVRQLTLPFDPVDELADERVSPAAPPRALRLDVPGVLELPDGRQVSAEWIETAPGRPIPRSAVAVELDAERLAGRALSVRFPSVGDRFHPLGGPGRRKLTRFLADVGVPREDRGRIPLVCVGDELVWVCGLRPSEPRRVRPETTRRLRLELRQAAACGDGAAESARDASAQGPDPAQPSLFEDVREAV